MLLTIEHECKEMRKKSLSLVDTSEEANFGGKLLIGNSKIQEVDTMQLKSSILSINNQTVRKATAWPIVFGDLVIDESIADQWAATEHSSIPGQRQESIWDAGDRSR
jgi:hypothetical protein